MLHKGEWVEVYDRDLKESYIAQVMADHDETSVVSPMVRIAYCLAYPRQTAIIYPDVPNENVPIAEGTTMRMPFLRRCNAPPGTYASGLEAARQRAQAQAQADCRNDVLSILERHERGEYSAKRRYCRG